MLHRARGEMRRCAEAEDARLARQREQKRAISAIETIFRIADSDGSGQLSLANPRNPLHSDGTEGRRDRV